MGREVRMVPKDWEHPKDEKGIYIPLFGGSFSKRVKDYDEEKEMWEKGFMRSYKKDDDMWIPKEDRNYPFEEWSGSRPQEQDYMPDWPEEERTHFQMYENVTEGTPISPPMESPEALVQWLAENGVNAGAFRTATYEQWLRMISRGYAPTLVGIKGAGLISGVEGI